MITIQNIENQGSKLHNRIPKTSNSKFKFQHLLIRMSLPWQSISKWWFMTSDGWTKPPRWLCNGSWCAIGLLISVIAIDYFWYYWFQSFLFAIQIYPIPPEPINDHCFCLVFNNTKLMIAMDEWCCANSVP